MLDSAMSEPGFRMKWLGGTLVCGVADIGYALLTSGLQGVPPGSVLRGIAVGPFGKVAKEWGMAGAALGLAIHFAIMGLMVLVFLLAVRRWPALMRQPLLAGVGYGTLLYLVMYWIVLPLRWTAAAPKLDLTWIAPALFPHVVLVGIPLALLIKHWSRSDVAPSSQLAPQP